MPKSVRTLVLALCWIVLVPGDAVFGGREWANTPLGKCKLDKPWAGPSLGEDQLWGNVTVVFFWNDDTDASAKALGHLVKLDRKLKRRGLIAVAAYYDTGSATRDKAIASPGVKRVNFTIVPASSILGEKGRKIEVPHATVYNCDGAVAYNGYPNVQMDKKIMELLKTRPAHPAFMLIGGLRDKNKYKEMSSAVAKIHQRRFGDAWKECEAKRYDTTARGDQARALLQGLERYADRLLGRADEAKDESPRKAVDLLNRVRSEFKGCVKAEEAAKTLQKWQADKSFRAELLAEAPYRNIERMAAGLPSRPLGGPERAAWERRYGRRFRSLETALKRMAKSHGGTKFLEQAQKVASDIAEGLGEAKMFE